MRECPECCASGHRGSPRCSTGASGPSPTALEVEITAHREQAFEAVLDDDIDGPRAQAAIGLGHPAVREVAVVRKEQPQRLVDTEQVLRAIEQVAVVGERLAAAIARERAAAAAGKPQHRGLLGGAQVPVDEQARDHRRQAGARVAGGEIDGLASWRDGRHAFGHVYQLVREMYQLIRPVSNAYAKMPWTNHSPSSTP